MPFIKYTAADDKAAGRGRGKPAVTRRSVEAYIKAARQKRDKWVPVRSSWVAAVKFNSTRGTFDIRVKKGGKEYDEYPDMTRAKFYGLLRVRSVGKWMWRHYPPKGRRARARPPRHRGGKR